MIVFRHADRDLPNTFLNETGIARLKTLAKTLEGIQIDAVFVANHERNILTGQPIADARGLPVQIIPERDVNSGRLAERIFELQPTGTSVWVGNTDNINGIWEELDAPFAAPTRYGKIVVLEFDNQRTVVAQNISWLP